MTHDRKRKGIYRSTLNDGLGKKFRIQVTVIFTDWIINGELRETIDAKEWLKVEKAIEKKYPGWFHTTCFKGDKKNCPACKRNRLISKKNRVLS